MLNYFAACPRGLEGLLREELEAAGAENVKETVAGVSFSGTMETGIRTCLETRFATRVLLALGTFYAGDDINFYNGAYSLHYEDYFDNIHKPFVFCKQSSRYFVQYSFSYNL